jgi:hypothetical protein
VQVRRVTPDLSDSLDVSDQEYSDLVEIVKRNGEFKKTTGLSLALFYFSARSMRLVLDPFGGAGCFSLS